MSPRMLVKAMEMLLSLVRVLFVGRANLALANLALRQQVAALKRDRPRPPLGDFNRGFGVALKEQWSRWSNTLVRVTPGTVVRWHPPSLRVARRCLNDQLRIKSTRERPPNREMAKCAFNA